MKEKQIFIPSTYPLEAILSTPINQTDHACLIISGSGKGDMDGNFKSLKMNIYKKISDYLVQQGYATLRYNKRGIGESGGTFNSTGLNDLLDDMGAMVTYLKQHYKKIYLVGHSEGAILATLYNDQHPVNGMVLISGAGTDLKSALNYQQQCLLDEIKDLPGFKGHMFRFLVKEKKLWKQQYSFYDKIEASTTDTIRIQLVAVIQAKWMREHFAYQKEDVLHILQKVNIPTLAITGTKDVQANVKDLEEIDTLQNPYITTKQIENMTHMLRIHEGPKSMLNLKKQYKGEIKQPIAEELFTELTNWFDQLEQ